MESNADYSKQVNPEEEEENEQQEGKCKIIIVKQSDLGVFAIMAASVGFTSENKDETEKVPELLIENLDKET